MKNDRYSVPYIGDVTIVNSEDFNAPNGKYFARIGGEIRARNSQSKEEVLEKIITYARKIGRVKQFQALNELSDALSFLEELDHSNCLQKYQTHNKVGGKK